MTTTRSGQDSEPDTDQSQAPQPPGDQPYDLIVLGAGSAGMAAATAGSHAGGRVLLVERNRSGGTCLWTGTLPSKCLIAAARTAQLMRTADRFAITPVEPAIDFGELMRGIERRLTGLENDRSQELAELGIDLVRGTARFTAPDRIAIGEQSYRFGRAVIATGSAPVVPPIPRLADCAPMTTDDLFELRFLPERLTVIGGGPTGCELGQAFARLGAHVTIIERRARLLPTEEPEVGTILTERFRAEGVDVLDRTDVLRAMHYNGHNELTVTNSGGTDSLEAGRILIATGRRPATTGLDLSRAGVATGPRGYIAVDGRLRTSNRKVYAAGDAIGEAPQDAAAEMGGQAAAEHALSGRPPTAPRLNAQVIFTDPEVGRVGLTAAEATDQLGERVRVRTGDGGRLDRAITEQAPPGLAKFVTDERGRLLGATVISSGAGESLAELARVLHRHGYLAELADLPRTYPTWSDAVWNAAVAEQQERNARRGRSRAARR